MNTFKKIKLQIKIIEDLVNNNCQQKDIFIERIDQLKEIIEELKDERLSDRQTISKKQIQVNEIENQLDRSNNRFTDYKAIQDSLNHMTAHNGQLQRKLKRIENRKAN
jgi:chromosome segregation ATPase